MPQVFGENSHRCPNPLQLTLQDGPPVLLRPVLPADRERIERGVAALSSESRYFRFFTPAVRLSDQQLRYFSEVDQRNHVAWIALDASNPKHPGLGIARFVRSREDPKVAEVAFAVIDAYQGRGVGTTLLAVLYLVAQPLVVAVLRAVVLGENTRVTNWLLGLGATESWDSSEHRLDLIVHRDPTLLPRTPSGENFRHAIEAVQSLARRNDVRHG